MTVTIRKRSVLPDCCSGGSRRFGKLVNIHELSPDIAGGVHVGKDDLDIGAGDQGTLFGYAGEETGDTDVSSLMTGLDVVNETAILHELKLGAVVTAFRTSGSRVETVQCKDFGFTVWSVGGHDKVLSLCVALSTATIETRS